MMEERLIQEYLRVTGGVMPAVYADPERQGQQIEKFSLFESADLDYSDFTNLEPGTTI